MGFTGLLGTHDSQPGNLLPASLGEEQGGTITSTLPALTQALAGNISFDGPIVSTLPALQSVIVGPALVTSGGPPEDRTIGFRYELLDDANRHRRWLDKVLGGRVGNNALAEIKRTAAFRIQEVEDIDWLSDRIRPWVDLNGQSYPQGVFLLSSPSRKWEKGVVVREIEAYDQGIILRDDKVTDRYTVASGTNYITAVKTLIEGAGITDHNLVGTSKTLPVTRDWDPGTSKGQIVNDLLGAINYKSLFFDSEGKAVAVPYQSPSVAPALHTYRDDDESVVFPDVEEILDLFDVANKWTLVVSEPDRAPLSSTYTNSLASSLTSTVSRGRTIVDFRTGIEAADQTTLDALASKLAFEASQVFSAVEMRTALMPTHGDSDVIDFEFSGLGIASRYVEHEWEFEMRRGAEMRHRIRRIVQV